MKTSRHALINTFFCTYAGWPFCDQYSIPWSSLSTGSEGFLDLISRDSRAHSLEKKILRYNPKINCWTIGSGRSARKRWSTRKQLTKSLWGVKLLLILFLPSVHVFWRKWTSLMRLPVFAYWIHPMWEENQPVSFSVRLKTYRILPL